MAKSREEKIRDRLFPGVLTFNRKLGGFTTVPIILRRLQFLFSARAWQVYTYVLMRTGEAGVAWLTYQEVAHDLDFRSVAKLKVYFEELVRNGWLLHRSSSAKEYFIAPDPHTVLESLHVAGRIPGDRRDGIDELLDLLDRPTLGANPSNKEDVAEGHARPAGSEDKAGGIPVG